MGARSVRPFNFQRTHMASSSIIYKIPVLDHGFIKLLNIAGPTRRSDVVFDGSDIDPAQTARISFDNLHEDRTQEQDLKLVRYLHSNKHTTPIEMIDIYLEMKLPFFVARQFIRHRTISVNEVSARYTQLPNDFYIPEVVGGKPVGGVKQGQSDTLSEKTQNSFKNSLTRQCKESYIEYEYYLNQGVAPEHARMFLHMNFYTHWVWKQDLHNLMHFLRLRDHSHAQLEARLYAQAIKAVLRQHLPESMAMLDDE